MNAGTTPRLPWHGRFLRAGLLCVGAALNLPGQAQTTPETASPNPAQATVQTPAETKAVDKDEHKGEGPGAATAPGLQLSADGAYVLDAQNKLAWLRCVEGMTWNGHNCVGEPRLMTYTTAQALAAARAKADG
ncbi:hypothetical protein P3G55_27280, partial [Leptospira sp. 96542]|nr:hypothetical protein [Leptospira sp. 96542]